MQNRKIEIIVLIIFLLLVSILSIYLLIPKIELIGKDKEIIEMNKDYYDLGAKINNKKVSYSSSNLDTTKTGKYKITYSTNFLFFTIKKERNVEVTDKKLGVIEVSYNQKLTFKGKTFKEDKIILFMFNINDINEEEPFELTIEGDKLETIFKDNKTNRDILEYIKNNKLK